MSNENYALIVVDVQHDFLPGGALGVPEGEKILFRITQLAQEATLTVASRDWHPEDHFSFSDEPRYEDGSWPPHCIQGTRGAKLHSSVRKYANFVVSKGMDKNPPDAYSAFSGRTLRPVSTLEEMLQRSPITAIVVVGLALDYCVGYTAFDARALGYRTIVPLDATRGVTPETSAAMVAALITAGVEVVDRY